ncbi:putative AMP-activated protein kinase gamma regulatory subunit [Tripterygium wilfordii]|uniref:Putative AMP-activated protein kinase gamma regulatory subunit n=1 Tax=Tripterygium wilfordii TaxID=458696 RepID=A0A7J7CZ38_TRIWF|nr:putative AMP-activated protein kinase gamma regulatory subunit [Tripterygium wilfordii]
MQQQKELNTAARAGNQSVTGQKPRLKDRKVKDLTANKRRLVEVPYTATLGHTMNALLANKVVAVPVAAPPGHWIGAGGSMIMESDKHTGAVRKHYIGMVNMFDILAHIAGDDRMNGGDDSDAFNLDEKMSVPVSNIIGHCLEDLSLWTLNPNTSVLDCMELLSKGVHRALVPVDSQMENVSGVELVESASSYRMLTQMDLLMFVKEQQADELQGIMSRSVGELGAVNETVFAITDRTKVIEAIKNMRAAMLNAVPIVQSTHTIHEDHSQLVEGGGRKVVGTFSATDLRGCHLASLKTWLRLTALHFTEEILTSPLFSSSGVGSSRELVTCHVDSPLGEVIDKAVSQHVHRVWVVDRMGLLVGLVSLTDMIRVLRASILSEPNVL